MAENSTTQSPVQSHHVIPQEVFKQNPLLRKLETIEQLSRDDLSNLLNVPTSDALAKEIGVGPHHGSHPVYSDEVLIETNKILNSTDGQAALAGDKAAAGRVVNKVRDLEAALKTAIANGELSITRPADMLKDTLAGEIKQVFGQFDEWRVTNKDAIATTRNLIGAEAKWTAVIRTPAQVEVVAKALEQTANTSQLNEYLNAVAQARDGGRLAISEGLGKTLGSIAMKGLKGIGVLGSWRILLSLRHRPSLWLAMVTPLAHIV